ncbi:hypothetical protein HGG75_18440 [Ochrobactrum pseudogrignonense]|nr:hypothetical protein [Brucella pseudogrignonensis]
MIAEQNEIFDEFQISLLVRKHGWSNLVLSLPNSTHTSVVTDVFSDIVNNILTCCEAVIDNHQHTQPFYDEPGGSVWRLNPDPVMRHLVRVRIFDLPNKAGEFSESELAKPVVDLLTKEALASQLYDGVIENQAAVCGCVILQRPAGLSA